MKRPTRVWSPSSVEMTSFTRWLLVTFYTEREREREREGERRGRKKRQRREGEKG